MKRRGRKTHFSPGLREELAVTHWRGGQCGEELPQCWWAGGLGQARSLEQMPISVKTLVGWKLDINWT